jgi:aspartate/methionine/tyrosine aminotransferase
MHRNLTLPSQDRAPYMEWAKHRPAARFDLAASNLLPCSIEDLEGAREALSFEGSNEDGYPPLIDRIASHYGIEPSRIMTANGCSGANLLALAAVVSAGDEVLIEKPYYDPIAGAARLLGASVRFFERRFDHGYQLDVNDLGRRCTSRTRLIVLTNPHNPSGTVIDDRSVQAAADVAASSGAHLLVDEVYLDIVNLVEGRRHTPAALLAPNAISTSSLTKSYGLHALRCGWAIGPPAVAERMRRARDVVDGVAPLPSEHLSVLAFDQISRLSDRARALAIRNLDLFRVWMIGMKRLELPGPPRATIAFPRVRDLEDTTAFAEGLQRAHDVAVVPGHFFGAPQHIRISLSGRQDLLKEGLDRLAEFLRS